MSGRPTLYDTFKGLLPLVPHREKRRFVFLLGLAVVMAFNELLITGLVALLAAVFGASEAVIASMPMLWLHESTGITFAGDARLLAMATLCMILCSIACKNAFTVLQQWHLTTFAERVGIEARSHIFRFYQRAPFLWIVHTGVAELNFGLSAATSLAGALAMGLQLFTSMLMLATLFLGLVGASPIPSMMFLAVLGIGGFLIIKNTRKLLDRCAVTVYIAAYEIAKITHMALHGLKEMRLCRRENTLFSAYRAQLHENAQANAKLQTVSRLPVSLLEILGFTTLVGVMSFLIFAQDAGMARISGIMGFLAATAWRALPVANKLMDALSTLRSHLPYLRKVTEIIGLERSLSVELLPIHEMQPPSLPFSDKIVMDRVSFQYPTAMQPAIQDVSITIEAGQMVGIVGLSGAGKSTLVNLLTGLMAPQSGSIQVDGVFIDKDTSAAWLGRIGYVAQSPYILDASLAENIALSRWGEAVNRDRVLECCRMASLDFLDELEDGLDTVLGERGARLSGGQAQRVAIARALYSDPDLIIFDEATSSLDMKNEKAIHETILSLRSHVTMVIVAHRLSSVEGCDLLVWLDKGRVVRKGDATDVLPAYMEALRIHESCECEKSA